MYRRSVHLSFLSVLISRLVPMGATCRMTIFGLAFTFVLGVGWQTTARAAGPWYVTPVGNDTNDCRSTTTPCKTITSAMEKASSGDTINVAGGTYTEALTITKDLLIAGDGITETVLDGGQNNRVIYIPTGTTVGIADVSVQHGRAERGGGIYNGGMLALTDTVVTLNVASVGGGIYNDGTVELTHSSVTQNMSVGIEEVEYDDALYIYIATITAEGGGIYNANTATLTNSTISDNDAKAETSYADDAYATAQGGGIVNVGTLRLSNVTVNGNHADASAFGTNCSYKCSYEGSAEAVSSGGGMANRGTLSLRSVTIADNATAAQADANYPSSTQEGGGIANTSSGRVNLVNTILAENASENGPDCFGPLKSQGYNLIQEIGDCTITGVTTGNITGQAPYLGPLQNNGGSTQTQALLWPSAAIDAGNDTTCSSSDQRGVARPADGDGDGTASCDIGAYELAQPYIVLHVYVPLVHR